MEDETNPLVGESAQIESNIEGSGESNICGEITRCRDYLSPN